MKSVYVKSNPSCPVCHANLSAVGSPNGDMPKPGDITICAYCASVLTFTDGLGLEQAGELSPEEQKLVDSTLEVLTKEVWGSITDEPPKH